MFTSNIGTITTVLNLNIYLHCEIVFTFIKNSLKIELSELF